MQLFANNAATKLAAAVADTDTTITVDDASVFPSLGSDDWFLVTLYQETGGVESNHEIVRVTGVATNDLTVERGQEGTTAQAFSTDDPVELRNTAGTLDRIRTTATVNASAGATIEASDGDVRVIDLTSDTTLVDDLTEGQSAFLKITGSDDYSITWPTVTWRTNGESPPDPAATIYVEMLKLDGELLAWEV